MNLVTDKIQIKVCSATCKIKASVTNARDIFFYQMVS